MRIPTPRADRQVGRLIALCSLVFVGSRLPLALSQTQIFMPWFTVAACTVAVVFVLLAVAGARLPDRFLRACWALLPGATVGLQFASYSGFAGSPIDVVPWVWSFEAASMSMTILVYRIPVALTATVISAFSVAGSAVVLTHEVPQAVWAVTPLHLGNIGFVVIFLGIRNRLAQLNAVEDAARDAARRSAVADASAARERELTRVVHDEVLSVLGAATMFRGWPPRALREEAAHAITVLEQSAVEEDPSPASDAVWQMMTTRFTRIAPGVRIRMTRDGSAIPSNVVTATADAASEALRNVVRHADAENVDVDIELSAGALRIFVRDDGKGFDPADVAGDRLGVRDSILARMVQVGGSAQIRSIPHGIEGAEVLLTWEP